MFSSYFSITSRIASMLIILILALIFNMEAFTYKAIFVGLLFSHFFYGLYYSKRNIIQLKEKPVAMILALLVLAGGLYFSFFMIAVAPYFLVVHTALSDAYLLPIKSRQNNPEPLKLIRCVFYIVALGLVFIPLSTPLIIGLSIVGLISFIQVFHLSEDKKSLLLFEIPLLATVVFTMLSGITLGIFILGFYHILTWYVFSFWMLFIKEKDVKKGVIFFGKIALVSLAFILTFGFLNMSITDVSFPAIIGFWSILHITTSLFLSKFNPQFVKNIFYAN